MFYAFCRCLKEHCGADLTVFDRWKHLACLHRYRNDIISLTKWPLPSALYFSLPFFFCFCSMTLNTPILGNVLLNGCSSFRMAVVQESKRFSAQRVLLWKKNAAIMIVRHLFFFSLCNKTQSSWTYKSLGFYLFINSSSKLQYWHPNFPTILNYIGPEQHPNSFRFVFVFCNRLPELQVQRQSVTFRHDIQTSLSLLELHVWRKRPPLPRYQLLSSVCWSIFDIWTSLRPCPQVLTAAATLRDLQWKHLGFGFMYFFFFFVSAQRRMF